MIQSAHMWSCIFFLCAKLQGGMIEKERIEELRVKKVQIATTTTQKMMILTICLICCINLISIYNQDITINMLKDIFISYACKNCFCLISLFISSLFYFYHFLHNSLLYLYNLRLWFSFFTLCLLPLLSDCICLI